MNDKFPPLTADPHRYLMECYDSEGRLVDVRTPSLPPRIDAIGQSAFEWARDYLEVNASISRIRISSLFQLCWVGGRERG